MLENFLQSEDQHLIETFGDMNMSDVDVTLNERGTRYGDFAGHAAISQGIKRVMQSSKNWQKLRDDQKESLEMTAHKIGRILNGDPDYKDSWHDIVGYNKLVDDTLTDK